ncbi:hypothetical protein MNBD_ALPHA09-1254 [hydrothermal vent metagenome]|uniref:HPt domain-containing protein n=1 Tax=hydrothermal vent metagenome TaxID=652676 RepID=A0A3B0TF98_9ZZZZ
MAEDQLSSRPDTPNPARRDHIHYDQETLAALAAADRMLVEMGQEFSEDARRRIETIQAAVNAHDASAADAQARCAHAETVFDAAHELRGQAGSLGYGLLGELCNSLCTLLELEKKLDTATAPACADTSQVWEAIVHHTNAVTTIVENEIRGDGGDRGRELVAEVARLREVLTHAPA